MPLALSVLTRAQTACKPPLPLCVSPPRDDERCSGREAREAATIPVRSVPLVAKRATNGGDGGTVAADRLIEERIAENDSRFRDANERIEAVAVAVGVATERVPFICECADRTCQAIVPMTLAQYEEIRANPRHFLNVPGHQVAALGAGEVVGEHDGYVIVEKRGHAGKVAEALDDRALEASDQDAGAEEP